MGWLTSTKPVECNRSWIIFIGVNENRPLGWIDDTKSSPVQSSGGMPIQIGKVNLYNVERSIRIGRSGLSLIRSHPFHNIYHEYDGGGDEVEESLIAWINYPR